MPLMNILMPLMNILMPLIFYTIGLILLAGRTWTRTADRDLAAQRDAVALRNLLLLPRTPRRSLAANYWTTTPQRMIGHGQVC